MIDPQELDRQLDAFLELPQSKRAGFLEELDREQGELAAEIKRLWGNYQETEGFLEQEQVQPSLVMPTFVIPEELGSYRVIREIGQGGMGRVFLAERADGQFNRQVAVKFIRLELSRATDRLRFEHERNILAQLSHPHIAQLQDSGITDEGHPYFIMEYVEGTPILAYCNQQRLDLTARLDLFMHVCEAVQHAHQNLIVHRDLKSGNILVTRSGDVKLLDFGIAKVLEGQDEDSGGGLTRTGHAVFTPECASPEQVLGEPVNAATDIYALGMLLYRLVSGHFPLKVTNAYDPAFLHSILHDEPEKPSLAVLNQQNRDGIERDEIADQRQSTPAKLSRQLSGDLDIVALKCLRKEKRARYGSVAELINELERFKAGLPIQARSSNWRYQTVKFVRRNRWLLALGATVFIALLGYAVTVTALTQRVRSERDRASEVANFLSSMLETADPHNQGRDAKVTDFLNSASEQLELSDSSPEIKGTLHRVLGFTYRSLSDYPKAKHHLDRSLHWLNTASPESAEWFDVRLELAQLAMELGDIDQAIALVGELEPVLKRKFKNDVELSMRFYLMRILCVSQTGDVKKSLEHAYAFEDYMGRYGLDEYLPARLELAQRLGTILIWDQRPLEAIPHFEMAVELADRVYGDEHPSFIETTIDLAGAHLRADQTEPARAYLESILPRARESLGDNHVLTLDALFRLGVLYSRQTNYAAAVELLGEAEQKFTQMFSAHHHTTASARSEKANAMMQLGYLDEAEMLFLGLHEIRKQSAGPFHPNTIVMKQRLADIYRARGELHEAEYWLCDALTAVVTQYGEDHHMALALKNSYSLIYNDQGLFHRSRLILEDIQPKLIEHTGWGGPAVNITKNLIQANMRTGQYSRAVELLKQLKPHVVELSGESHEDVAWCDRELQRAEEHLTVY